MQNNHSQGGSAEEQARARNRGIKIAAIALISVAGAVLFFFIGFFVYYLTLPEGVRSLLWMKEQVDDYYYRDVSDDAFWNAALNGASSALDDYSQYYDADSYDAVIDDLNGKMEGIGASFFGGTNKLYKVAIGSPAFFADIVQGDSPVEAGMFLTGAGTSADALTDILYTQVGDMYVYETSVESVLSTFETGDTVYLRFSKEAGDDTENCVVAKVTLAEYTESYVLYAGAGRAYAVLYEGETGKWTDVSEYVSVESLVPAGTGYIRIVQFSGNVAEEFRLAAEQYAADGEGTLVLDLRNNGGGSVAAMADIAGRLMKEGKANSVVQTHAYKNGTVTADRVSQVTYDRYFAGSAVYVATNYNTASASEGLIGAMVSYGTIDYDNIFITATGKSSAARTFGKGIMQAYLTNSATGACVKLTVATVYWPNGKCIHGTGITTADGARLSRAQTFADYGDAELQNIFASVGTGA